jgi:uncharacterized protein
MDSPFVFGRLATKQSFTNRTDEIKLLTGNFQHGVNTTLISPRRWGKSSLVKKSAEAFLGKNKTARVVYLDLFSVRTEESFYKGLSEAIFQSTTNKIEEFTQQVKHWLGHLAPKISLSPDPTQHWGIEFELKELKQNAKTILNLPQKIAIQKGIRIIVCIDEFQNIGQFAEPVEFQKLLRSVWQHHQQVTYCLYGSRRHMLMEMFNSSSMPFYRFGEIIQLKKISSDHWTVFIVQSFAQTKKAISVQLAERISNTMQCHSYYTQQLAHRVWIRTEKKATEEIFEGALQALIEQNSFMFERAVDQLPTTHLNFLKAMIDGVSQFSAAETLKQYALGTSANISKIKSALEQAEIIDFEPGHKISLLDPAFQLWLVKFFFRGRREQ